LQHLRASLDLSPKLEQAAARLEAEVKSVLSHLPGEDHSAPWLRTGMLHESISHQANATEAVVGSSDPVALYQELGTHRIPPRPFLAPTAASLADELANDLADAIRSACEDQP
jgi:phage gpG-like protein